MNHKFHPSQLDSSICAGASCRRIEADHLDTASCESCGSIGPCDVLGKLLLCINCMNKEIDTNTSLRNLRANNENMLNSSKLLEFSKKIENSINLKTDIFNAEMVSLADISTALIHDVSILPDQKNYTLAKIVMERIDKFQSVIFEKREELEELENKQKADQIYLNNLALKLLNTERESLKLNSPNYNPIPAKVVKVKEKAIVIHREDKNIHAFAKMMGLPFEHAKRLYLQRLDAAKSQVKSESESTDKPKDKGDDDLAPVMNN